MKKVKDWIIDNIEPIALSLVLSAFIGGLALVVYFGEKHNTEKWKKFDKCKAYKEVCIQEDKTPRLCLDEYYKCVGE